MKISIQQARLWNPVAPIFILSSVAADYGVGEEWVRIEDISKSTEHLRFEKTTLLDTTFREGFWRYTTERLFILHNWMLYTGTKECIHLENDNPMYYDISDLLPTLRSTSKGISAPFHGQATGNKRPHMCYSIIYCNDVEKLASFLFFLAAAPSRVDEMQRGGEFWIENEDDCSLLPCVPPGSRLVSETLRTWCENAAFPCIFDAMAHGQFMGGQDPRNPGAAGPYINPDAEFRADQFLYGWKADRVGRRFPVVMDRRGKEWRLVNLHIHSKRLENFI